MIHGDFSHWPKPLLRHTVRDSIRQLDAKFPHLRGVDFGVRSRKSYSSGKRAGPDPSCLCGECDTCLRRIKRNHRAA